jgi:hypothetical protein
MAVRGKVEAKAKVERGRAEVEEKGRRRLRSVLTLTLASTFRIAEGTL